MALTQVQPGMLGTPQPYSFKNRIINGQMQIDQRNAGASVTNTTSASFPVDRWIIYGTVGSKFTAQQVSTSTLGFTKSLKITSSSAYTVGSGDAFFIQQRIEGNNVADLGWGTANAKTVTLSFVVNSSLTGTFGGSVINSAYTRSYPFTFSIASANTDTTISVTIPGDTSGTWVTDNGIGMRLNFNLGSGATYSGTAGAWAGAEYYSATGATSVVGTNGATFYITGVQLEVGTSATGFDYRPYGTELALCQRYYQRHLPMNGGGVGNGSTTLARAKSPMFVVMRTYPSIALIGTPPVWNGASSANITSIQNSYSTPTIMEADLGLSGSFTVGQYLSPYANVSGGGGTASAGIELSAEL